MLSLCPLMQSLMLQNPKMTGSEGVAPRMPLLVLCCSYDAVQRKVTLLFIYCIFRLSPISNPMSNLRSGWVLNCDYILIENWWEVYIFRKDKAFISLLGVGHDRIIVWYFQLTFFTIMGILTSSYNKMKKANTHSVRSTVLSV